MESKNEEFPLTRAMLVLLDVLADNPMPRLLGAGTRTPGFDPYLNYILRTVFLKFNSRSCKNPSEKVNCIVKKSDIANFFPLSYHSIFNLFVVGYRKHVCKVNY